MNCTCIERVKKQLVEHAVETLAAENPRVAPTFTGIDLATGDTTINLTFVMHADNHPFTKAKGMPMSVTASFCPFCGASMKSAPTPA